MKKLLILLLIACSAFAQQTVSGGTTNGDILPASTGQNLGSAAQMWNAYLQASTVQTANGVQMVPGESLATAVANCGSNACTIRVTGSTTLTANVTVPSTTTVVVDNGGYLTGAFTLTVNGLLVGPDNAKIFDSSLTVSGLQFVRPEWFGTTNCCQTAVNALASTGGTVLLRKATYVSDYNAATMETKDNVTFLGSGMPLANTARTALANGTIIQGRWALTGNHVAMYDLGVDSGSAFINGGTSEDAVIVQAGVTTNIIGFNARNISCLVSSSTALFHCFDVEHVTGADIRNIVTTYGVHGVVYKGTEAAINGVYCRGHQQDCVIMKCNGTSYGSCGEINLSNVHGESIVTNPPDTGGIKLEADDEPLDAVSITGVTLTNVSYGIMTAGAAAPTSDTVSGVTMSALKISGMGTGAGSACLNINGSTLRVTVSGMVCDNMDRGLVTDGTANASDFGLGEIVLTNMNNYGLDTDITNLQVNGLKANIAGNAAIIHVTGGTTYANNVFCTGTCSQVVSGTLQLNSSSGLQPTAASSTISFYATASHASLDLASVLTGACTSEVTETISGAALADRCMVSAASAVEAGGFFACKVTASNTVKWQFCNLSGGSIDRASDTYWIRVLR